MLKFPADQPIAIASTLLKSPPTILLMVLFSIVILSTAAEELIIPIPKLVPEVVASEVPTLLTMLFLIVKLLRSCA